MINKIIKEKIELEKTLSEKERTLMKNELELKYQMNKDWTDIDWKSENYKKYSNKELKEAFINKKHDVETRNVEETKQEIKEIKRQIENKKYLIKYIIAKAGENL